MSIGTVFKAEWQAFQDPDTRRQIRQFTRTAANNYPLYYFIPSITSDNRFLIFHSERTGWVQLFRMDLVTGEIVQLTDGGTQNSGWAIWCEYHLRGIRNHLSALNTVRNEVYYFEEQQLRSTNVHSLENRLIYEMPDRSSVGQTAFSPDGRYFAFIHADRRHFTEKITEREALCHKGKFDWGKHHHQWRNQVPTTIGIIDTESATYRDVIALDYHVHHVLFIDNRRLLVNHVKNDSGMWCIQIDGTGMRTLRPRDEHGVPCHQVVSERGIYYEANQWADAKRTVYIGRYDPVSEAFDEVHFPGMDYVHTGFDPAGKFLFYENQGAQHQLLSVHFPHDPERFQIRLLRTLAQNAKGQRYHAHPFLSHDRRWLFFTEMVNGFSQILALDVADLVDLNEYWEA
ncbi:hypothetical protein JXJ21_22855 [candidate division KSB1 bacterium]|nr:hypothetical protein [candidate division KSB1 bacterium]